MTRPLASIFRLILCLGLAGTLCGCCNLARPHLLNPGSEQVQQARALRYDPYPEPNIGPSVDGSRPRNYEIPLAEPARSRWTLGNWE